MPISFERSWPNKKITTYYQQKISVWGFFVMIRGMLERVQFVDENDAPIGGGTREEAWEKGIYRRISRVILKNEDGEILIQKRSPLKKTGANCWTDSSSGHVDEGEGYDEAAHREMFEEIGITTDITFLGKFLIVEQKNGKDYRFFNQCYTGTITKNTPIKIQEEEVSEAKWISIEEVKKLIHDSPEDFTSALIESIKRFY